MFAIAWMNYTASLILTISTATMFPIVARAQASNLPTIPLGSAPQSAWAKMEKLFILYVRSALGTCRGYCCIRMQIKTRNGS